MGSTAGELAGMACTTVNGSAGVIHVSGYAHDAEAHAWTNHSQSAQIARASAQGSNQRTAGGTGLQQAIAAGVPVDMEYLAKHPEVASQVPLAAPAEDRSGKYSGGLSAPKPLASQPSNANARTAADAFPYQPITSSSPFATTSGVNFVIGGSIVYPSGTSWYNLFQPEHYTTAEILLQTQQQWQKGVRLFRAWGHINGYGNSQTPTPNPAQITPGLFSEATLRRMDQAMDALAKVGTRIIISMVNYWPELGGIQWYVDNVLGPGRDQELFYTDPAVRAAYKLWVQKLATRVNTVNGRVWGSDPTIFAWELCNECHTSDNYEINRGLVPGSILYNWQVEMSAYLKTTLGVKSMVTNGNEGYRARGQYDPNASIQYPYLNWVNTGLKGEDFNRNLYIPTIDFGTIHVYPSNFGVPNTSVGWVNDMYIGQRMFLARGANKPLLLEEYGAPRDYLVPRSVVLESMLSAANAYQLAGTLVWESYVAMRYTEQGDTYDFTYTSAGNTSVLTQNAWMLSQRGAGVKQPWPFTCTCSDLPPDKLYTCAQQAGFDAGTGNTCCASWMVGGSSAAPYGFCQTSCGQCGCNGGTNSCPIKQAAAERGDPSEPLPAAAASQPPAPTLTESTPTRNECSCASPAASTIAAVCRTTAQQPAPSFHQQRREFHPQAYS
eukprot:CAMPEP_0206134838 /NCGR_PEP_ID=MMETSP1473-20131121/243_1 /ASSEMBLY_ACC=CAM_ASM_001109 /TAXON_ID=1461547 /ORGANISM="Stichococcus sp, Strain RCC1054" /LENGTH=663 /DNA_ID=CAMNT_0053526467 /DNA_START=573 /DNA_END=2564 /DNA_ORIENTATION=+